MNSEHGVRLVGRGAFTVNFPQEETSLGFATNACSSGAPHAERFMEAVEHIAAQMVGRIDEFLPCVGGALSDECVDEFIEDLRPALGADL